MLNQVIFSEPAWRIASIFYMNYITSGLSDVYKLTSLEHISMIFG